MVPAALHRSYSFLPTFIPLKKVLPVIVLSQFFCTSLWFASNAIMPDIVRQFGVAPAFTAQLSSMTLFGFITGTLLFAILGIADRFSPSKVFFVCSVIASASNFAISVEGTDLQQLMALRFITGFFLAGIYPVGMKIAADHYEQGLGRSLGFLVGALVMGTAFPHLLKSMAMTLPWKYIVYATSALAAGGGLAMLIFVPDGPYRKPSQRFDISAFLQAFRNPGFRAAAFGYFGHMWELYAFWVFVPIMLSAYNMHNSAAQLHVPLLSFFIIAGGGLSCMAGGIISQRVGVKNLATVALAVSGACCLISPLVFYSSNAIVFILFLFLWGMAVIADSPMFSTLVAKNAPAQYKGTALTIVNCIGFSITIVSIQLLHAYLSMANERYIYILLAIGPALGLWSLYKGRYIAA